MTSAQIIPGKRWISILLCLAALAGATAQPPSPELGRPLIRHFFPEEYRSDITCTSLLQDDRGLIYVANQRGVLEYDGAGWRLIPVPIGHSVRALAQAGDGVIYTGGVKNLGFLAPDEKGRHVKLQQIGRVVIRDHAEIGANTCIDRAAFGETVVGEGVKIDNLVQIGHNCVLGDHSVIVSQTGISGSCEIGRHTIIAGQTGISDHVKIADQVTLLARSGVFRDITEPGIYGFAPAMKGVDLMRFMPVLLRLPEMASQIRDLERKLESI